MPYYYVDNDLTKVQDINNDLAKIWNIDNNLDLLIIDNLYKPVDNNKDWIIAVFFSICQN